jgi:glycosyltransferase involved in cell wall biosynthesis
MKSPSYVLITPVRNEEATLGITIESVVHQTILPKEWVIVSDQSTDRTDEIIKKYALEYPFIRLLRLESRPKRNFASAVFALEAGIASLETADYEFLGFLDGDIRFQNNYYEEIIFRLHEDPHLGAAGGLVIDCNQWHRRRPGVVSLTEIAGAVQFFRRDCFESLGGLVALPEGGWDTITCVQARINGFRTRTFPEIEVDHLKPRNIAEGNFFRRTWQLGIREYALGNHPQFEVVKCAYRCVHYPYFIGGIIRLAGYLSCYLTRRKRLISREIIRFIRQEQLRRLYSFGKATAASL